MLILGCFNGIKATPVPVMRRRGFLPFLFLLILFSEELLTSSPFWTMAGHSGYPKISGRVIRVFEISGFEKYNPKFVENNQNPTFRVPDISGSGSG